LPVGVTILESGTQEMKSADGGQDARALDPVRTGRELYFILTQFYFRSGVKVNTRKSKTDRAVQVRFAEPADAESITSLINLAFGTAESFFVEGDRIDLSEVRQLLRSGKFLQAESKGKLLACVYVEPHPDRQSGQPELSRAYLGLLAVVPARQHSGLGSMLIKAAEDHCRKLGCGFMDIKIVNLRDDLPHFYRGRRYIETGTSDFPKHVRTNMPCHFVDMSNRL